MVVGLAAAVLAALLQGGASTAQAVGANHAAQRGRPALLHPLYVLGMLGDLAGWGASLVALQSLPLLAVQPILATSLVVTVMLNVVALKVRPTRFGITAMLTIVVSVALVALSSVAAPAGPTTDGFVTAMIVVGAVVTIACVAAQRSRHAVLCALLGGLAFGLGSIAGRHLDAPYVTNPLTWVMLVTAAAGTIAFAHSLEVAGPQGAARVTAWLWVTEVVVPAVVGVAVLGDLVRPGWWPVVVVALPVAMVATVALSSHRAMHPSGRSLAPRALSGS